jgi:hypothetical protein
MPIVFHATNYKKIVLDGLLYPLDCYHDGQISFTEITAFSLAFSVTEEQWDLTKVGLLVIEYLGKEYLGFDMRFLPDILVSLEKVNLRIAQFHRELIRKIAKFT